MNTESSQLIVITGRKGHGRRALDSLWKLYQDEVATAYVDSLNEADNGWIYEKLVLTPQEVAKSFGSYHLLRFDILRNGIRDESYADLETAQFQLHLRMGDSNHPEIYSLRVRPWGVPEFYNQYSRLSSTMPKR